MIDPHTPKNSLPVGLSDLIIILFLAMSSWAKILTLKNGLLEISIEG